MNQMATPSLMTTVVADPSVRIPPISIAAFYTSVEQERFFSKAFADRRMARASCILRYGDFAEAIETYQKSQSPDLIILETALDYDAISLSLEPLAAACSEKTKLIVLGKHNDIVFYRNMRSRGVSDYAVAPLAPLELITIISQTVSASSVQKLGRSIALIGSTGGCGVSTIAQNIAVALGNEGSGTRALLADFDIPFGSAALAFNFGNVEGSAQAIQSAERLDDVLLERLLENGGGNVSVLPAPATLDPSLELNQVKAQKLYENALKLANIVVCDLPHVWSSWTRDIIFSVDEVVIVSQPTLLGLKNTNALIRSIKMMRPNDFAPKLVINQVGMPKRREIAITHFEDITETKVFVSIQNDPQIFSEADNKGEVVVRQHPSSKVAKDLQLMATKLAGIQKVPKQSWGIFRRLFRK